MPNRKTQRNAIYVFFAFLYVLSATYAMSYFFNNSYLGDQYPRTRFDAMVDGYAAKPFIYRQLIPALTRSIDEVTTPSFRNSINDSVEELKSDEYKDMRRYTPWFQLTFPLKATHYKRLVASILIMGFLIGYMAGLYYLGREMFPDLPAIGLFAPIFGVLGFTSFGYQWQYIYDIPCLCLSTACFYFMYKGKFRLYLFAFFLAALNKETAIFSLVFFSIWYWNKLSAGKFAALLFVQGFIYLSVKIAVTVAFINNGGFFLERNMQIVLERDLLGEANIYKLAIISVIWFMLTSHWQEKPLFLKRTLLMFPVVYTGYFFYGYPHEYRVFFDLHAPLILLMTHTLVGVTGIARSPVFSTLEPANIRHAAVT